MIAPGETVNFFVGDEAYFVAPAGTMKVLARMLAVRLATNDQARPVIDTTGLEGKYDVKFWWSPRAESSDFAEGPSLLSALEPTRLETAPPRTSSIRTSPHRNNATIHTVKDLKSKIRCDHDVLKVTPMRRAHLESYTLATDGSMMVRIVRPDLKPITLVSNRPDLRRGSCSVRRPGRSIIKWLPPFWLVISPNP